MSETECIPDIQVTPEESLCLSRLSEFLKPLTIEMTPSTNHPKNRTHPPPSHQPRCLSVGPHIPKAAAHGEGALRGLERKRRLSFWPSVRGCEVYLVP